ncbi:MAG: class II fructose-bisphosphate aldolase [Candidatus Omnitrophota bacterium]|nr:MAG: class II fructose-bisphosphate aldolase [Candidatus Omnitrophota bacterium]
MVYHNETELLNNNVITVEGGKIKIKDLQTFRAKTIDDIADTIILGESAHVKRLCYWVTYEAALGLGIIPTSIQELYEARGKGEIKGFTVPAMNIRTLTYDIGRAVFRSAKKINAGAFIFEIAKSEIGYTDQRPLEYASILLLAAMKAGFQGPVFFQGDHFQVKATNYLKDKDKEINPLKELIKEAIEAGFYNIDIDSSTLVDLDKPTIDEQQKLNYGVCALFTKFIRRLQPKGIEVSVGGEIGEVGGKNSTPEEFHAFMKGYRNEVGELKGISKMSIQTGTSHGGVVLPDGTIAKVKIDFDTLKSLSEIGTTEYKLSGCVQHGASTLPNEAFHRFPEVECSEIHLATQFQNIVYDYLPISLKEKIYDWLHQNCADEKKPEQTDDQFIYKTRKKALGPFKKEIHSLTKDMREKISSVLEKEFDFLFSQLNIKDTAEIIKKYVKPVAVQKSKDEFLKEEKELGKLEGAD